MSLRFGELEGASGYTPPRRASPATPPQEGNYRLQRRGIAGCRGGELAGTEPTQPPRQAELDTPPEEGNCRVQRRGISWYRTHTTAPSGFARHPFAGGELPLRFGELEGASGCTPPRRAAPATPPEEGNCRYGLGNWKAQAVVHHPVKRSLTPLHRRGIAGCRGGELAGTEPTQPPRQAAPATPPEEGNCRVQRRGISWYRTHTTTPSGFDRHPSAGGELPLRFGELEGASGCTPPRQAELDTPPQEGNCRVRMRGITAPTGGEYIFFGDRSAM